MSTISVKTRNSREDSEFIYQTSVSLRLGRNAIDNECSYNSATGSLIIPSKSMVVALSVPISRHDSMTCFPIKKLDLELGAVELFPALNKRRMELNNSFEKIPDCFHGKFGNITVDNHTLFSGDINQNIQTCRWFDGLFGQQKSVLFVIVSACSFNCVLEERDADDVNTCLNKVSLTRKLDEATLTEKTGDLCRKAPTTPKQQRQRIKAMDEFTLQGNSIRITDCLWSHKITCLGSDFILLFCSNCCGGMYVWMMEDGRLDTVHKVYEHRFGSSKISCMDWMATDDRSGGWFAVGLFDGDAFVMSVKLDEDKPKFNIENCRTGFDQKCCQHARFLNCRQKVVAVFVRNVDFLLVIVSEQDDTTPQQSRALPEWKLFRPAGIGWIKSVTTDMYRNRIYMMDEAQTKYIFFAMSSPSHAVSCGLELIHCVRDEVDVSSSLSEKVPSRGSEVRLLDQVLSNNGLYLFVVTYDRLCQSNRMEVDTIINVYRTFTHHSVLITELLRTPSPMWACNDICHAVDQLLMDASTPQTEIIENYAYILKIITSQNIWKNDSILQRLRLLCIQFSQFLKRKNWDPEVIQRLRKIEDETTVRLLQSYTSAGEGQHQNGTEPSLPKRHACPKCNASCELFTPLSFRCSNNHTLPMALNDRSPAMIFRAERCRICKYITSVDRTRRNRLCVLCEMTPATISDFDLFPTVNGK